MIVLERPRVPVRPVHEGGAAVIGGGILGLFIALRLAQRGERVTLIEGAPELGGLAKPWRVGDVTWDRHYHVILRSDRFLRALLAELDLDDELEWGEPRTAFYTDGALHSMSNLGEFMAFPPLGLLDKARLGATILYGSQLRDGEKLEAVGVEPWLVKLGGRRTFERIWKPLLRAKLGDRWNEASAAFIWAILVRLYGARRRGVGREQFGYVAGGYDRIIRRLVARVEKLGVTCLLGTPVDSIRRRGDRLEIVSGDDVRTFERAVVTVPATRAARMCADLDPDERERLEGKRYMGIVCASLVIDRPLGPYYVTNLTDPWIPFSAVIDMAAVVDRRHFGGKALVYLPKYVAPDDPLFERSDEEIVASYTAALERMYPDFQASQVRAARVSRVREVFPIATLGYSRSIPPIQTSVPGLFLINSAHIVNGTLNVDETLRLAQTALDHIDLPVGA